MSGKPENVQFTVSISDAAKKRPEVGVLLTVTERVVKDKTLIVALSTQAYDFIALRDYTWVAPNGVVVKAKDTYNTEIRVSGETVTFFLNPGHFRGKRCNVSTLAFAGSEHVEKYAERLAEAMRSLAGAITTSDVSMFDGLDTY